MNWPAAIQWLAWAAKWGLGVYAAGNAARLSTPDTVAGPVDYLLWVALPAVATPAAAAVQWLASPSTKARPLADTDPAARDRRDVGLVVARMVADGKHDAAAALIEALKRGGKS